MALSFLNALRITRRNYFILLIVLIYTTTLILAETKCSCKNPSTKACREACQDLDSSIDWLGTMRTVGTVASVATSLFGLYAAVNNHNLNNAQHRAIMANQQREQKEIASYENSRKGDDGDWEWLVPLLGFGAQLLGGA